MPEIVKKKVSWQGTGRPGFDWDSVADGRTYRLVAGKDFKPDRRSLKIIRSGAHSAARTRGMAARTMIDGDDLIIQFVSRES